MSVERRYNSVFCGNDFPDIKRYCNHSANINWIIYYMMLFHIPIQPLYIWEEWRVQCCHLHRAQKTTQTPIAVKSSHTTFLHCTSSSCFVFSSKPLQKMNPWMNDPWYVRLTIYSFSPNVWFFTTRGLSQLNSRPPPGPNLPIPRKLSHFTIFALEV